VGLSFRLSAGHRAIVKLALHRSALRYLWPAPTGLILLLAGPATAKRDPQVFLAVHFWFHRSITFWSGLLVMSFVCWAWSDSVFWNSALNDRSWYISSSRSGVSAYYTPPPASFGNFRQTRFKASPSNFRNPYLPSPSFARGAGLPQGPIEIADDGSTVGPPERLAWETSEWTLFVPYWLILLAIATVWLALLFWRARRRKQALVVA
jgi:hypothetical protein